MLCGLCHRRSVRRVGAAFAYGLLRAIHFLQHNWTQLAAVLRPDPELAQFVRSECSKDDSWSGVIARIWSNTKYLDAIATGSMAQYIPALNLYSGGLPIVSAIYGSSESYFGLNLEPPCDDLSEVSYTIMPNMAYLEFLPTDAGDDATARQQLVELADVEVGREYELVVTTYGGLCRYLVGDVLRVTGFHNAAPRFRFVRRRNVVLSVDVDKTDEAELQRAVERASELMHGAAVLDYTSRACVSSVPGHYVIYWELLLASVYLEARVAVGSIGPLEIRVVASGTFEELADHAIACGSSIGQYKSPRCVAAPAMVELLDSRVISTHFSPRLPRWSPGDRFDVTSEEF